MVRYLIPLLEGPAICFNPTIDGIEDADALLIVGANPRFRGVGTECPHSQTLARRRIPDRRHRRFSVTCATTTRCSEPVPETLKELSEGKGKFLSVLKRAKRPMIIVGQGALTRSDSKLILSMAAKIAGMTGTVGPDWNGFWCSAYRSRPCRRARCRFSCPAKVARMSPEMMGAMDVLFLLGADELDMSKITSAFTVYVGTHGDAGGTSSRCHLARSGLSGKERHLREHGRSCANGHTRYLPAGCGS